MKTDICDICGKTKGSEWADTEINGRIEITTSSIDKESGVSLMSYEIKDIYLCPCCSKKVLKCIEALKEGKKIKFRGTGIDVPY